MSGIAAEAVENSDPPTAPSGLCPACLLKAGLLGDGSQLPDVTITFGPASSSVLASLGEAFGKYPAGPAPGRRLDHRAWSGDPPVIARNTRRRSSAPRGCSSSARSPAAAWGPSSRAAIPTSVATWPSRSCSKRTADKPDMVRRFVEEAQIGGQFQHPGIVPVYELGTFADRRPFFAMKLVKGQHPGRAARASGTTPARIGRGSWRSSSRSARRWPTPTPAA